MTAATPAGPVLSLEVIVAAPISFSLDCFSILIRVSKIRFSTLFRIFSPEISVVGTILLSLD